MTMKSTRTVISVEHLTKQYDLGLISSGTLARDLSRWWARVRGKEDPFTRLDNTNPFLNNPGESILALDDVSFKVEEGQALGIIGRNGAGKSTLLKILSRVTAPTNGVVKIKGRIGSLLEVGTGFHPELTGRENVFLNGAILGMSKAEVERKFDEIVDFSGVEKFIDTPVKRYSSGMYVRLAFAVAAHLDPEILIVDEVLAVGDAEFQKKCLGKMGDVAGEGRTVLFVSHNMESIAKLCSKTYLLSGGKIDLSGPSQYVIDHYIASFSERRIEDENVATQSPFYVTNSYFLDENGSKTLVIERMKDFSVILRFTTNVPISTDTLNLELRLYESQRNQLITIHSTRISNYKIESSTLPDNGTFRVDFVGLPLKAGAYRVSLAVKNELRGLYYNENELQLTILDPPDFSSGLNLDSYPFNIVSEAEWKLLDSD